MTGYNELLRHVVFRTFARTPISNRQASGIVCQDRVFAAVDVQNGV
jgi:hypothetical protein